MFDQLQDEQDYHHPKLAEQLEAEKLVQSKRKFAELDRNKDGLACLPLPFKPILSILVIAVSGCFGLRLRLNLDVLLHLSFSLPFFGCCFQIYCPWYSSTYSVKCARVSGTRITL